VYSSGTACAITEMGWSCGDDRLYWVPVHSQINTILELLRHVGLYYTENSNCCC